MRPPVKRRPGQHHGDLRSALLAAALDLVAEHGPRGFTVSAAARRAGVSSGAPYKHFADRDALLAALAERGYREQARRFAAALEQEPADPAERLVAVARAYVAFAVEQRALFEVVFGAGLDKSAHAGVAAASAEVVGMLLPVTSALAGAGDAAQELLLTVAAVAHGYAVFLLEGAFGAVPEALPAILDRVADAVRDLLCGRPAAGAASDRHS